VVRVPDFYDERFLGLDLELEDESFNSVTLLGARITALFLASPRTPRYAYEIATRLDVATQLVRGQFNALERRGWITPVTESYVVKNPVTRGTPRSYYALTPDGRRAGHALLRHIADVARAPATIRR
jgi:predicted ArsR family transcriptional regulator